MAFRRLVHVFHLNAVGAQGFPLLHTERQDIMTKSVILTCSQFVVPVKGIFH